MKGLLIKDFLLLRSYGKSLLLMFLLFLIIGATSGPAFIVGIVMIESVMLAVSTFSYDDMAKWNSYMLLCRFRGKQLCGRNMRLLFC